MRTDVLISGGGILGSFISLKLSEVGLESIILENIKDYSWEYKRFRRPPEGSEDPYKL